MSKRTMDEATKAGRGVLYIAFAKFYFMLAGAVIEFRLPVILTNTVFGAYAVVASAVSPLNNVLITGTIQGVSRFVAQTPTQARRDSTSWAFACTFTSVCQLRPCLSCCRLSLRIFFTMFLRPVR